MWRTHLAITPNFNMVPIYGFSCGVVHTFKEKMEKTLYCNIPVLPVFADARNTITQAFVTYMLCQKKLNICINKILIYNRKWFRPFIWSQTSSKHHNYQASMCVLCSQWRLLFSAVGRIGHGEINKLTESLNVSSKRLKRQYFIMNNPKTRKTHTLSI